MSDDRRSTASRRLRTMFAARTGALLVRLLGMTWRCAQVNAIGFRARRAEGKSVIFALWHGELLVPLWVHRGEGIAVLISTHADGEIIARIARSLGFETVRGSTSRGGARAIRELSRVVRAPRDVAITPDGPRGPRHRFAPGALALAAHTGVPVVCVRVEVSRAWRLGTWDGFLIPKPFASVTVHYSDPRVVEPLPGADAQAAAPAFESLMAATGPA